MNLITVATNSPSRNIKIIKNPADYRGIFIYKFVRFSVSVRVAVLLGLVRRLFLLVFVLSLSL
jgi:hypothetical protein